MAILHHQWRGWPRVKRPPLCVPGPGRSEIINPHYGNNNTRNFSSFSSFFPLKIQSHFRFLLCIFTPDQKMQPKLFLPSGVGWLENSSTWGRDVDIDLHSKRVGSLIKQRFVAKELVWFFFFPKENEPKGKKKMKRDSFADSAQLTIGPEYKPPSVIQ